MKPTINGDYCESCGLVFTVAQFPWPYTGEAEPMHGRYCPNCGARLPEKEGKR